MKITELEFEYPETLIATLPSRPSRVMKVGPAGVPEEITLSGLCKIFKSNDVLVINNTKVLKRRVFVGDLEVLFLKKVSELDWEVLFPSKKYLVGSRFDLPLGLSMELIKKGRPQLVRLSREISESYFTEVGELPLPPYIQKIRSERHNQSSDEFWYQTEWAKSPGSFAAPTASLHFSNENLNYLKSVGVEVCELTLHVGLGTFLPVVADDLDNHHMHEEFVEISKDVWEKINKAKISGNRVWALGTTSARALESAACGKLAGSADFGFSGCTDLLIQPGFEFKVVDHLLTNFHQPRSTLLALVAAFSSLSNVKTCYKWAIEREFRLFSYGDLSCWLSTDD